MSNISTARELRRDQTKAEAIFWNSVRNRQFLNLKWRRQVPIDKYIADFVCEAGKLIVELDGIHHGDPEVEEYDVKRTGILEQCGYRVMRFWNKDVLDNFDYVLTEISNVVGGFSPHPAAARAARTSPQGEGL